MSVIVSHFISISENPTGEMDLPKILREKGFLGTKELYFYDYKNMETKTYVGDTVLDYSKAPDDVVSELREAVIKEGFSIGIPDRDIDKRGVTLEAAGFVKQPKKDPTSSYTYYRRELSEQEIEGRMGHDVIAVGKGIDEAPYGIHWSLNYYNDDTPGYIISKMLPEITFEYEELVEGDVVLHSLIKDGELVKDFLEEKKCHEN